MPPPEFTVNATRYDPYKNFRFKVVWDGRPVAGISRVGGLSRTTQVVSHREGGDFSTARKSPGQSDYGPITLERGVTHDLEFENWANKAWNYQRDGVSLKDFRKDLIMIELYNEAGQKVIAYKIYRCWVSDYQAMADLDASGNDVLIQSITIENEGWERDTAVVETAEPSFPNAAATG